MSQLMSQPEPASRLADKYGIASEYPFDDYFFSHNGHRIHFVDEGTGDPILFVHGNPTWSFAWRKLISAFSNRYRCIAIDHIGCGFSDKPQDYEYTLAHHIENLQKLVEHLDLQNITLVAHDWGGAIGTGVAGRMPERFQKLVLMNTAAFRSQVIPFRIAVCRIPGLGAFGVRGLNLFAGAAVRMAVAHRKNMTPEVRRGYLCPYDNWANRIATHEFVLDIPLSEGHRSYNTLVEVEENLSKLNSLPVLLPWGMQDWCFTAEFLSEFERRFPHARSVRIDDANHYLFEDAPQVLIENIDAFLAETPAEAPSA